MWYKEYRTNEQRNKKAPCYPYLREADGSLRTNEYFVMLPIAKKVVRAKLVGVIDSNVPEYLFVLEHEAKNHFRYHQQLNRLWRKSEMYDNVFDCMEQVHVNDNSWEL